MGQEVLELKTIEVGADVFITSDLKYHDYYKAEKSLLLVDVSHYESEQFTNKLMYDILEKNSKIIDIEEIEKLDASLKDFDVEISIKKLN